MCPTTIFYHFLPFHSRLEDSKVGWGCFVLFDCWGLVGQFCCWGFGWFSFSVVTSLKAAVIWFQLTGYLSRTDK